MAQTKAEATSRRANRRLPSSQTRGRRLAGSRSIERAFNGSDEIRFAKRLADDHCAGAQGLNSVRIATDKEMRDRSRAEDFLNSRNTASSRQSRVDDHQVRPVSGGRRYRVGLSGRCGADIVPHSCKQFRKQGGNQGVVLDDEDSKRFHRSICARPELVRHYYSCSSCSVAGCGNYPSQRNARKIRKSVFLSLYLGARRPM
jgi:hypothetical protein